MFMFVPFFVRGFYDFQKISKMCANPKNCLYFGFLKKLERVYYEVTMSGALMANYYMSWRLENNVTSSKYLFMRAFHDRRILKVTAL